MIAGFFDPVSAWPLPKVEVTLLIPEISTRWVPIEFVLDTGSATTCLHPRDAMGPFGIDAGHLLRPDRWPQ